MKHELLVPVGEYKSLIAAINNGADAVYLAGKKYGARAYADNFSLEEMEKAIKLCHLYGVKIYVTVNTLVYENEIEDVLSYIESLHKIGVDALIMQDIGLINLVHQTYPNLEIHASTQMHNYSKESLEFLKTLGIKRVVYARELPLEYINSIDTDLEKEVFIHGSLCVSYSGQCLFSSCILNRSANRGMCAGMCRLKYDFYEDNKKINTNNNYLLSPMDLSSLNNFKELMDSNIKTFKIEGRMKSPLYVATITRIYKKLMNDYEEGKKLKVDEEDLDLLKSIFYRGYTNGFLFNEDKIMNYSSSNHIGLYVGKVLDITKDKIKIKLDKDIKQNEGIRFKESDLGITLNFIYDEKDKLIKIGKKGSIIYLDNFINLKTKDSIYLTNPILELDEVVIKKIKINASFKASENEKISLTLSDGENEVTVFGDIPLIARDRPITNDEIKDKLLKTGNTPFIIDNLNIDITNNLFIRVSSLNNLRREALDKLKDIRENKKTLFIKDKYKGITLSTNDTKQVTVLARTKEQIKALKEYNINIVVDNRLLMEDNFYYKTSRNSIETNYNYSNYLNTTYSNMIKYRDNISDYFLNITNHYALDLVLSYSKVATLSVENNLDSIKNIMNNYSNSIGVAIYIYGNIELMMMKACLIKNVLGNDKCSACFNKHKYYLKDRNNKYYRVLTDNINHTSYILNTYKTNLIKEIPKLRKMGINNFRIDLLDESYDETKELIENILKYMEEK